MEMSSSTFSKGKRLMKATCGPFLARDHEEATERKLREVRYKNADSFTRWETQADLDQHTNRPWLQAIRRAFDEEDLIVGGEVINPVSVISGFTDRKVL